jgi:hypothetical protein
VEALTKEEIHKRCSLILTNFYHFNRDTNVTKDKVAFQNELNQLRKLLNDLETTKIMKVVNPCTSDRIINRIPFFLLEAVHLDKSQTDLLLDNIHAVF